MDLHISRLAYLSTHIKEVSLFITSVDYSNKKTFSHIHDHTDKLTINDTDKLNKSKEKKTQKDMNKSMRLAAR